MVRTSCEQALASGRAGNCRSRDSRGTLGSGSLSLAAPSRESSDDRCRRQALSPAMSDSPIERDSLTGREDLIDLERRVLAVLCQSGGEAALRGQARQLLANYRW